MISPRMFSQFFLPTMAEVSRQFGLIYYGCCEPVHDRWEKIIAAIPNVRAVSVSPWCDRTRHRREAGAQLHLLAQTQGRAHQRREPGLGRLARGSG